jgi:hypothetical protein
LSIAATPRQLRAERHQEGSVLTAINALDCLGYYKRQRSIANEGELQC